jgi:predicted PurR-regulated permease PerM
MNEPVTKHSAPSKRGTSIGARVGVLVLAAAAIAGVVVCVLLAAPFLGALTWALALAILFAPLHARIEARLKYPDLAAAVSILIIALVVAVPAAFVVERLVVEAAASATIIQARVASGAVQRLLEAHPGIAPIGNWIEEQIDLPAVIASLATSLSNVGASFARRSIIQSIEVVLTFYLLYYFLRDRHSAGRVLRNWLPLTSEETERLFFRAVDTVHATIYGTLAVAAVQGTLGGLMFWFLGLQAPLLWGLVMGLLSVVPVLGAFVVWIPAALLLLLDGSWGKALILAAWGAVVVGGIDNVLRPIFVGNRLSLHTVPAFISMIGGLLLFGAYGFILGPLTVTLTVLLLEVWRGRAQSSDPKVTG